MVEIVDVDVELFSSRLDLNTHQQAMLMVAFMTEEVSFWEIDEAKPVSEIEIVFKEAVKRIKPWISLRRLPQG